MMLRRFLFWLICLAAATGLGWLLLRLLEPGGWTAAKIVMGIAFLGTLPWTCICAGNGWIGFLLLVFSHDAVRATFPISDRPATPVPRTAIALTVRREDLTDTLPAMRRLLDDLDAAGHGNAFALFVLSDTPAGAEADMEAAMVAGFQVSDPGRIHYRRRRENTGFKAGNIMEFLDNGAGGFELMLTLDADSILSAPAVLRMARAMVLEPRLGIVQHLTVGMPSAQAFTRLFQFGMRAGMRVWATGQAWWQGPAGPYWGHNAMVRIAPFREHCRLAPLSDGRAILSHDQVEAALLAAAGWHVRVLAQEAGSQEANPPGLPEFLARDARWMEGNLQYVHLLGQSGFAPMGRWQMVQAILLFAGAPLYLVFALAAATAAASDAVSAFPAGIAAGLTFAWAGILYGPKLLGYVEVAMSSTLRRRYGGLGRFLAGCLTEFAFTLLLDAVMTVSKTLAMLRLALAGRHGPATQNWALQNRRGRSVGWGEATRLFWPHAVLGMALLAGFGMAGWGAALWSVPFVGGLVVAIPLCVWSADPRTGAWLRARGIAAVPEEIG